MGSNFNVVTQEVKKEEEEFEEEIDDEIEEEKEEKQLEKNNKNKMIKYMMIFMGIFFGLLLLLWLVSLVSTKHYEYEDVETVLENAAISYFKDYPESLPKSTGNIVEVDYTNLVQAEKMKDLTAYLGEGTTCEASVTVEKTSSDYLYTPYLNCGDLYATKELYKAIQEQGTVTTGEYGLYRQSNTYVYRGEKVNNYIKLKVGKEDVLWRIVKVNSDNSVVIIKDTAAGQGTPFDDRYNEEREFESGINNFGASRIKDQIEKLYTEPDKDLKEVFISKKDKNYLTNYNMCVGKRTLDDTGADNKKECSSMEKNTKVGLLTLSDYMNASIDGNCKVPTSGSCKNYNYLVSEFDWWLVTANQSNSYESFVVTRNGDIKSNLVSTYAMVRPVVTLNNRTMYKSGKGTKKNPFILK